MEFTDLLRQRPLGLVTAAFLPLHCGHFVVVVEGCLVFLSILSNPS